MFTSRNLPNFGVWRTWPAVVLEKMGHLNRKVARDHWCYLEMKSSTLCPKEKHPWIFDCNVKTNYHILVIFGKDIPDTTCHQITIHFPTSPNVCFCITWGKQNKQNITFYPMRYNCLTNIMRKNTFCSHFWHIGWHFIQLSILQLPAVKLLEVLAHYANTGKEMLSPFIDSSIDTVLLQTSAWIVGYLQNWVPDRVLKRVPGYPFGNYFEAAIIAT